jgi:hypothetical protein
VTRHLALAQFQIEFKKKKEREIVEKRLKRYFLILVEVLGDFGAVGGGGVVAPHGRLGQREARGHLGVEEGGGGEGGEGALGAAMPEYGAMLLRGAGDGAHAPVQLTTPPLHLQPVQQDVQRLQPHARRRPHLARIRLARVEATLRSDNIIIFN